MKVKIGNYRNRWIAQWPHYNYMNKKYNFNWSENQTKGENIREKIEDIIQWVLNHTVNLYLDTLKEQKIKVKIDPWDTWAMDHTLACIIFPMLVQLKKQQNSAPPVDDEDVPENLRSINAPPKEYDWDTDDFFFQRWNYVLDQMLFAFELKAMDDWMEPFYNTDKHRIKEIHTKIDNGLRLFGKYYEALWY